MNNILSVDVEGSVEGKIALFDSDNNYNRSSRCIREIKNNIDATLDLFSELGVKSTFFILGMVAKDIPELVYKIAMSGHEIGSHSYHHRQLFLLKKNEVTRELSDSKSLLEDLSSQQIIGFRAPFFSINEQTSYIFDLIKEAGYLYDSSIFPISGHDLYGIPDENPSINILKNGLIEMPMSTIGLLGKKIPVLGGGYFRLYPYFINNNAIRLLNKNNNPGIVYLHPYEIGGDFKKMKDIGLLKQVRFYHNSGDVVCNRIRKMIKTYRFGTHIDYLKKAEMLL